MLIRDDVAETIEMLLEHRESLVAITEASKAWIEATRDLDDEHKGITTVDRLGSAREEALIWNALNAIWTDGTLEVHLTGAWEPWIVTLTSRGADSVEDGGWLYVNVSGISHRDAAEAVIQAMDQAIPLLEHSLESIGPSLHGLALL